MIVALDNVSIDRRQAAVPLPAVFDGGDFGMFVFPRAMDGNSLRFYSPTASARVRATSRRGPRVELDYPNPYVEIIRARYRGVPGRRVPAIATWIYDGSNGESSPAYPTVDVSYFARILSNGLVSAESEVIHRLSSRPSAVVPAQHAWRGQGCIACAVSAGSDGIADISVQVPRNVVSHALLNPSTTPPRIFDISLEVGL